jgi:hypothetical protein
LYIVLPFSEIPIHIVGILIFKLLLLQGKKPEKETNIFYEINTVVLILNKSLEAVSIKTEVDYVVVRER